MRSLAGPFINADLMNDPYPTYARMRAEGPVHYVESLIQSHVVCRYADVGPVLKNPALFSSKAMHPLDRSARMSEEARDLLRSDKNMIAADPPLHTRMRALVSRAFTPRRVAELEPRIRQLTGELLDTLRRGEEWDLVHGLSAPLPVTVIAEMLGVEPERHRDFKRWSDDAVSSSALSISSTSAQQRESSLFALHDYLHRAIEERRRAPREDLISALIEAAGPEDDFLSVKDLIAFVRLLLIAGNDTTTNLITNGTLALLRNPAQWEQLVARPELVPNAVEEMLRYDTPVQAIFRQTTQELEVSGERIPEGARVCLLLGSANRDPDKFPEPERFDITREVQGHYPFGHGIHFCLGAPLARLEAKVVFEELVRRVRRLEFAPGQAEHVDWGGSLMLRGPKSLRIRAVA